jgi:hypothetical protein
MINHRQDASVLSVSRRLASVAIVIGPAILAALYVLTLITWRKFDMASINAPLLPIDVALTVFAVNILFHLNGQSSISQLDLELQLIKEERRLEAADLELGVLYRRTSYKSEITNDLNSLRRESLHYRRIANALQSLVIVGSIGSAALSSLSINFSYFRWATVVLTFIVGIAAGFLGYFKFRERSFYLQQTADAIEHEFNVADLGSEFMRTLRTKRFLLGSLRKLSA